MLCDVGISIIGITNVPRADIVVVKFRLAGISARDITPIVAGSKYTKLEGFSAVDITPVVGGSKQIFIEQ